MRLYQNKSINSALRIPLNRGNKLFSRFSVMSPLTNGVHYMPISIGQKKYVWLQHFIHYIFEWRNETGSAISIAFPLVVFRQRNISGKRNHICNFAIALNNCHATLTQLSRTKSCKAVRKRRIMESGVSPGNFTAENIASTPNTYGACLRESFFPASTLLRRPKFYEKL